MEKIFFRNKTFFYLLISYLILLLLWNSYAVLTGNLFGIIPIFIQLIIIYLLYDKNKNAKIGIKIWSIFLIIGPSLSIIGKLLKVLAGEDLEIYKLIEKIIMITIAILIFYFNENTVEIQKFEENEFVK